MLPGRLVHALQEGESFNLTRKNALTTPSDPSSPPLRSQAVEQVEDTGSPIVDLYKKKTGHLSAVHADFFKKWEELISFEEQDATRFASELWTMTAEEREKTGR